MTPATFQAAYPYQDDALALPVLDLDAAAVWYTHHFGMAEVARVDDPVPTVILERDSVRIGFAVNGRDATQDGAAILVSNIGELKREFEGRRVSIGDWRVDDREGQKFKAFFVTAPDGLCYYFHEALVD